MVVKSVMPTLVAHADWSVNPQKRWLAWAVRQGEAGYRAYPPEPVGPLETLLARLLDRAGSDGPAFFGVDFPIGLPVAYAKQVGIDDFMMSLPQFGGGIWSEFYQVAERASEISLYRPFYPQRPGGKRLQHLLDGLNLADRTALLRRCDQAHGGRRPAAPLFWTMGSQQVGKAAISGWWDLIAPGLAHGRIDLKLWPFAGNLFELFRSRRVIISETYPAEIYAHLGLRFGPRRPGQKSGKRVQTDRAANAPAMLAWARLNSVRLDPALAALIREGFGPEAEGEDRFDATVGLFGMLNVLRGNRPPGDPEDEVIRRVEGWILGM